MLAVLLEDDKKFNTENIIEYKKDEKYESNKFIDKLFKDGNPMNCETKSTYNDRIHIEDDQILSLENELPISSSNKMSEDKKEDLKKATPVGDCIKIQKKDQEIVRDSKLEFKVSHDPFQISKMSEDEKSSTDIRKASPNDEYIKTQKKDQKIVRDSKFEFKVKHDPFQSNKMSIEEKSGRDLKKATPNDEFIKIQKKDQEIVNSSNNKVTVNHDVFKKGYSNENPVVVDFKKKTENETINIKVCNLNQYYH